MRVEMDDLSFTKSCGHKSPTCMHLSISSWNHGSVIA